jgi:hypothetical protein
MIASSRQRNLRRLVMSSQPRSRRTRFTATSLAVVALAAAAAAAPAAQARPALDPPVSHHETQRSALVLAQASNAGFDWGSAGIGAAAGAGLVLVGAGSFALTYRGRVRVAR